MSQEQLLDDEACLDRLAQAGVVRDEEVHARESQRLAQRLHLVRIDLDARTEWRLKEIRVRRRDAIPAERVEEGRKLPGRIETLGATLLGLIYIPFMLTFMARMLTVTDEKSQGLMLILWLIISAKFCDVGALLSGKAFGKVVVEMSPDPD